MDTDGQHLGHLGHCFEQQWRVRAGDATVLGVLFDPATWPAWWCCPDRHGDSSTPPRGGSTSSSGGGSRGGTDTPSAEASAVSFSSLGRGNDFWFDSGKWGDDGGGHRSNRRVEVTDVRVVEVLADVFLVREFCCTVLACGQFRYRAIFRLLPALRGVGNCSAGDGEEEEDEEEKEEEARPECVVERVTTEFEWLNASGNRDLRAAGDVENILALENAALAELCEGWGDDRPFGAPASCQLLVPLDSAAGRRRLATARASPASAVSVYDRLAPHHTSQLHKTHCGPRSLATALAGVLSAAAAAALSTEEAVIELACGEGLLERRTVAIHGVSLDELRAVAVSCGAAGSLALHAGSRELSGPAQLRASLEAALRAGHPCIANYQNSRAGHPFFSGHFSAVAAIDDEGGALLLDPWPTSARAVWIPVDVLYDAMDTRDFSSGELRGLLQLFPD